MGEWLQRRTGGRDPARQCIVARPARAASRNWDRGLHSQHYHWSNESWFSKDTVSALADALEKPLDQIMEEAEEARFQRNNQAMVIADPDVTNYVTIPKTR
jgi:hypothetical protein